MSVFDKAKQIATVDAAADARLTGVLPLAELTMRDQLGDAEYDAYRALEDGNPIKEKLEYAEAYFALYHFALALKKLQQDVVTANQVGWGEGQIQPTYVDELQRLRSKYESEALKLIASYQASESGNAKVRFYAI